MKNVSENFKQAIKKYGRQIDVLITYRENGEDKFLDSDTLFSVTPITNGNILKSVMKQLNFESSVKVPKDTIINFKFGVLVDSTLKVEDINEMKVSRLNNLKVNQLATLNGFEYINFGKYVVSEEPEYNADTLSYNHKCYDKLIYSMKNYEDLGITYPITIKNYLIALANKIGLEVENTTFYNENKNILNELYLDTNGKSLGYTYRDILDEIAEVTGSIICINNNDKIEVRYLTETNETIDEDVLKDIDVTMNERYGAVNCVVLSRSAGADNIYYPDPVPENPVTIKIQDNQIMNFNNRSEFLPDLYSALNGLTYFTNDFKTTGICYLEIGDKYNIKIGENTYNCVLLNDEIDITQGLEEQIHTDMPDQSETDFKKADKTDMKINQTNLIVDKQNQKIESLITDMYEEDGIVHENFSTIQQDIDNIIGSVQNSGGINLLKNSVMFAYDSDNKPLNWELSETGTVSASSSPESLSNGGISGHVFTLLGETVKQKVIVKPDSDNIPEDQKTYYTFSTRIKKDLAGTCYVKIYNTNEEYYINVGAGENPFYEEYEISKLLPKDNYYYIEFYGSIDSNATFTDNMFNIGQYKMKWQQASGEIMNTQVNVSVDGVLVKSSIYNGDYTVMSSLEFAGYSNINGVITKIFTLNKDTTEVMKLKSTNEISMPPIKIVPITTGDLQGWAFVSMGGD